MTSLAPSQVVIIFGTKVIVPVKNACHIKRPSGFFLLHVRNMQVERLRLLPSPLMSKKYR